MLNKCFKITILNKYNINQSSNNYNQNRKKLIKYIYLISRRKKVINLVYDISIYKSKGSKYLIRNKIEINK